MIERSFLNDVTTLSYIDLVNTNRQ